MIRLIDALLNFIRIVLENLGAEQFWLNGWIFFKLVQFGEYFGARFLFTGIRNG